MPENKTKTLILTNESRQPELLKPILQPEKIMDAETLDLGLEYLMTPEVRTHFEDERLNYSLQYLVDHSKGFLSEKEIVLALALNGIHVDQKEYQLFGPGYIDPDLKAALVRKIGERHRQYRIKEANLDVWSYIRGDAELDPEMDVLNLMDVIGDPPDDIREIGQFVDGHGIEKGSDSSQLDVLLKLITEGPDREKSFHTISLMHQRKHASGMHAMGAIHPYTQGIGIVCGEIGKDLDPERLINNNGVKFVILSHYAKHAIPLLTAVYPGIDFLRPEDLYAYLKKNKPK